MKINELKVGKIYIIGSLKYRLTEKGYLEYKCDDNWHKTKLNYNVIIELNFTEVSNERWRAKRYNKYWFLSSSDNVIDIWEDNDNIDHSNYILGNYFKTKQEAENYKQKLLVIQQTQDWANRHNDNKIDWNNLKQYKWTFYWSHLLNQYLINHTLQAQENLIYFTSRQLAEECWNIYGNRWKKYVWRIKK